MREIKFRAWDEQDDIMYKVGRLDLSEGELTVYPENYQGYTLSTIQKPVLMQYTGLKDKNGVELYQDDIILVSGQKTVIECEKSFLGFYLWAESCREYVSLAFLTGYRDFEIIGNIHQNPELIKSPELLE